MHFYLKPTAYSLKPQYLFTLKTKKIMGLFDALMGNASEVSSHKVAEEFAPILIHGEEVVKSFRLIRDMFVFTNKRLILVDKQGLTGSKVDFHTIPYKSINHFSKRSNGLLDLDAELIIWVKGSDAPLIKEFRKGENINDVYKVLSTYVL